MIWKLHLRLIRIIMTIIACTLDQLPDVPKIGSTLLIYAWGRTADTDIYMTLNVWSQIDLYPVNGYEKPMIYL